MIKSVSGKSFKGQDFEMALDRLNLVVGPNGSGKSSRSMALEFLCNGYIMGIGKRNGDVFDACAKPGDLKVFAGCTVETDGKKTKFLKRLAKTEETGATSLVMHVRDMKASASQYAAAWASSQAPRLIDPDVFMALSPAKKLEELFTLFPPDGDLAGLSAQIEASKEKINALRKARLDQESLVATLRQSVARLELGTGTHADVETEERETALALNKAMADLAAEEAMVEAEKKIEEAMAKEAKAKLAAEERHAAEMKALIDRAAEEKQIEAQKFRDQAELINKAKAREASRAEEDAAAKRVMEQRERDVKAAEERLMKLAAKSGVVIPDPVRETTTPTQPETIPGVTAIEKIISAIGRAGCGSCAALMVAKREKRNLQGGCDV